MADNSKVKEIELDGYKFTVDTDLLDDVDAFEHIDRIENKGQIAAVVPLLTYLIGDAGYQEMKAFYAKADADAHAKENPDDKNYKGKFRISQLSRVYQAIIENFDPKD